MSNPCIDCDNYTDGVCCQSRPAGVLSTAYNYFVKPKSESKADDENFAKEVQRKMQLGTLVIGDMNLSGKVAG